MPVTFEKDVGDVGAGPDDVEPGEGEEPIEADPPALTTLFAQTRPYLPTRYIAGALCSGSLALSRRVWDWATAGGWKVARGRLAGLGLAGYIAAYEETHGQHWVLPVACGAWVVGALLPAKQADEADGREDDEDQDDAAAEEFDDEEPAPAPLFRIDVELVSRLARELASDPDAPNSRAVQLDHLLTHLCGLPKPVLVGILTGAGVPIREKVKYSLAGGRQQVRQGVRLADLPAVSGEDPATPGPGLQAVPAPAAPGGPVAWASEGSAGPSPAPTPAPLQEAG